MSHPPGLFDIGKLARAVSWASGPVKAGGRAVEVQMSTGTGGGNDLIPKVLVEQKIFSKVGVSLDQKEGEGFEQRAVRMPEWIEGRTSQLLLTISLGPKGNGKKPAWYKSKFGECESEQGKGGIFMATGIWKYFACN